MKHKTQVTQANGLNKKVVAALMAAGLLVPSLAVSANYVGINDNGELGRANLNGEGAVTRYTIAVGVNTKAEGLSAVSIGTETAAAGESAIAIGPLTESTGIATTAVGQGAIASQNAATAFGRQSKATGNGSTAIGSASSASGVAATAFGSGSNASGMHAAALGQGTQATGGNSVAVGQKAQATASAATAIGAGAVASANYSVATGTAATASGVASVASGLQSKAIGGSSVAFGRFATANNDYDVAVGANSVTDAAVGTDSATVSGITYSGFAGTAPVATVSVGAAEAERTVTNVAAGRVTAASTDAINGSQLYLVANQVGVNAADIVNIQNVNAAQDRAIAAAKTEVLAGDNVVISSATGGNGQTQYTINAKGSEVAAGSDYVTVSSAVNGNNTTYTVDLAQKAKDAIDRNSADIRGINQRVDDLEDDLRAGIAGATALGFLQRPNEAGKSIVSAAVGGYRDQQALAIGYAHNSDNNKWSIKAGVSVNTKKDVNWGGSVGYQW